MQTLRQLFMGLYQRGRPKLSRLSSLSPGPREPSSTSYSLAPPFSHLAEACILLRALALRPQTAPRGMDPFLVLCWANCCPKTHSSVLSSGAATPLPKQWLCSFSRTYILQHLGTQRPLNRGWLTTTQKRKVWTHTGKHRADSAPERVPGLLQTHGALESPEAFTTGHVSGWARLENSHLLGLVYSLGTGGFKQAPKTTDSTALQQTPPPRGTWPWAVLTTWSCLQVLPITP